MSATVISPSIELVHGMRKVTITIPTTVDAAGATCNFDLPNVESISIQAQSTNFNSKTVELKAAPDGTNFTALAAALQFTASGVKAVPLADCGHMWYQVSITGAPTATLTVTIWGRICS